MEYKKGHEISISKLDETFPGFIWYSRDHELCGWNPDTNKFISIDDGMCTDDDGKGEWLVSIYQLNEKDKIPYTTPYKHWVFEQMTHQGWHKLIHNTMDEIIIKSYGRDRFTIQQGNKSSDGLSYGEMLGMVAHLSKPEYLPYDNWMLTKEERDNWKNIRESIDKTIGEF